MNGLATHSLRRAGRQQADGGIVWLPVTVVLFALLVSRITTPIVLADTPANVPQVPTANENRDYEGVWPNPCGPACLGRVLKHFSVEVPDHATVNNATHEGTGIEQIKTACQRAGLHAQQVRLDVRGLERLLNDHFSVCAILALNKGHFGYVDVAREGQFRFSTLSGEARWWPASKLTACWGGEAMVISREALPGDLAEAPIARDRAPSIVSNNSSSVASSPLRVVYFHSSSCHECQRVKNFLPQVISRWGNRISLELRSIKDITIFDELFKYEKHYRATVAAPPAIFVGDKALAGDEVIIEQLDAAIANALANGLATFEPELALSEDKAVEEAVPSGILNRLESFGPGAVAIAGLIDGFNPCAFTTIISFLSVLAYLKKTPREILAVGAGFIVGMFGAYFLMGLSLLGAAKTFSVSHGLSTGLACGVAVLVFALAGWSLINAIRYIHTGDTQRVTLSLPKKVKGGIHKVIRAGLTTRGLVIGSVSAGFLVSIPEPLCTGQVCLPTVVLMTRAPGMQAAAISYLLLYNVMFILPLAGILAIACISAECQFLREFLHRHLVAFRLGTVALFVGLGMMIIITL